jgi:hypothetical protein
MQPAAKTTAATRVASSTPADSARMPTPMTGTESGVVDEVDGAEHRSALRARGLHRDLSQVASEREAMARRSRTAPAA